MATRDARHRKRFSTGTQRTTAVTKVAAGEPTEPTATHPERTRQRQLENECAQFLRVQQKLTGRKSTEEYARIRLVHRQDDATRKRHLHQNGSATKTKTTSTRDNGVSPSTASLVDTEKTDVHTRVRPQTARGVDGVEPAAAATAARVRPQSARLARPHSTKDDASTPIVAGQRVSVALLERCYYNPVPLTNHLITSRSAPRLHAALRYSTSTQRRNQLPMAAATEPHEPDRASVNTLPYPFETGDGSGRRRIVVNMRHLEIRELDDDDEDEGTPAAVTPLQGQRHERDHRGSALIVALPKATGRSAWTEGD